jgi:hypothetical protein
MADLLLADLETFEAISQNEEARKLLLHMATLSSQGRLGPFLEQLVIDDELDAETSAIVTELACDRGFLQAVAQYLQATRVSH